MSGVLTIGVDIGGTKIAAGVVDPEGNVLAKALRPSTPEDPAGIEAAIVDAVTELRRQHDVQAVGVAAAGFISPDRDRVLFAPNIAWRDYPLAARLQAGIDLPLVIENDANAAGWAEYRFGAGAGKRNVVMLTVGTGIGGALVVDGRLVRGAFGAGAELGHIKVVPGGRYCGCGHAGCWEAYASGTGFTMAARNVAVAQPARAAALLEAAAGDEVQGVHATSAARAGDDLALELFADLGTWLGLGMATLTAVTDPELFVIGGGLGEEWDLFFPAIRRSFEANLSGNGFRGEPAIVPAVLANDAGIVGAGDLARST